MRTRSEELSCQPRRALVAAAAAQLNAELVQSTLPKSLPVGAEFVLFNHMQSHSAERMSVFRLKALQICKAGFA